MENIRRYFEIEKVENPILGRVYHAQVWLSMDGGKRYFYSGNGKFYATKQECIKYFAEYMQRATA